MNVEDLAVEFNRIVESLSDEEKGLEEADSEEARAFQLDWGDGDDAWPDNE